MDDSRIEKYLTIDFVAARQFYDARAKTNKRVYSVFSLYLIIVSALLTVLTAVAPDGACWRWLAPALAATLSIAASVLNHSKAHENWLSFRASWDALERERRLFETLSGPYSKADDARTMFVERVEAIQAREGTDFFARHSKTDSGAGASIPTREGS